MPFWSIICRLPSNCRELNSWANFLAEKFSHEKFFWHSQDAIKSWNVMLQRTNFLMKYWFLFFARQIDFTSAFLSCAPSTCPNNAFIDDRLSRFPCGRINSLDNYRTFFAEVDGFVFVMGKCNKNIFRGITFIMKQEKEKKDREDSWGWEKVIDIFWLRWVKCEKIKNKFFRQLTFQV